MKNLVSCSLACLLALANFARAAAPHDQIAVSAQQMKALGIQVEPLRRDAAQVMAALPARVVLPPGGLRVVSAPLAGLAVQVFVQPGQTVAKGAPLVRIASPGLGTLQLDLVQAASKATLARRTAERERALFGEGIIAQRRLQEAEAALAQARAALSQARAALLLAGMAPAAIDRVAAGGRLEDAVTLTAAAAGVVTTVEVHPGQRVDPSTALLGLAQLDHLVLEIDVPAADSASWRQGMRVNLQGRSETATVESTSPLVSPDSQSATIRAGLARGTRLRPGELVTVLKPQGAADGGWQVPLGALAHVGKQAYVFVRTRAGFEARPVTQLGSAGQRTRVAGVLHEGDAVAVTGVVALKGAWLGAKGGQ